MELPNEEIYAEAMIYKCLCGSLQEVEHVVRDINNRVSVCYLGQNKLYL